MTDPNTLPPRAETLVDMALRSLVGALELEVAERRRDLGDAEEALRRAEERLAEVRREEARVRAALGVAR